MRLPTKGRGGGDIITELSHTERYTTKCGLQEISDMDYENCHLRCNMSFLLHFATQGLSIYLDIAVNIM